MARSMCPPFGEEAEDRDDALKDRLLAVKCPGILGSPMREWLPIE